MLHNIIKRRGPGVVAAFGVLAVILIVLIVRFVMLTADVDRMRARKSTPPKIRSATISNGFFFLKWDEVPGASGYEVLEYNMLDKRLAAKHKVGKRGTLKKKVKYSYSAFVVRTRFGSEKGKDSEKVEAKAKLPEIREVEGESGEFNEINLFWSIAGADEKACRTACRIYRAEDGKRSKLIAKDVVDTSYIDDGAECGKKYTYSVEPYDKYENDILTGEKKNTSKLKTPGKKADIKKLKNSEYGVKGEVKPVAGATCYKIFKKTGKKWEMYIVINDVSFVDIEASGNVAYSCVAGREYSDGKVIWGKKGGKEKKIKVSNRGAEPEISASESTDTESSVSSEYSDAGSISDGQSYSAGNEPYVDSNGRHPIMGACGASVDQMVSYYNSIGASYPSALGSKGASTINEFCQILYDLCSQYGLRSEIVFAQVCLETGNLSFAGSSVSPEQCNFSGLGATGGGVSGNSFASVREGLLAQIQHLRLYADSSYRAGSDNVDKRYDASLAGTAPYVEYLEVGKNPNGGGWAVGSGYAEKILSIADKVKAR